ncbi:MAG TPA: biotin--[acetyl-CoA-carboxylase] ligase [Streptosporangiaceae bacterium]|nr:biotin--[acetyl-CoA-carboxylase] ligase [Streptosporangiaceae bacterium]
MGSLDAAELTELIVRPGGLWREVRVLAETGSTNSDGLAAARRGEPEGLVLVAEVQTAGRGRLDRAWVSGAGAGLTFSVLLRPAAVPPARRTWLPLLAGVAVVAALAATPGLSVRLKWPNDVLASGTAQGKVAGILAEGAADAVVVGLGINVSQGRGELPVSTATSVFLASGVRLARGGLLTAVLAELERWYLAWRDQASPGDAHACGLHREYQRWCATLGREVTVMLPDGSVTAGTAVGVDGSGRLELMTAAGLLALSAGDVVHLR